MRSASFSVSICRALLAAAGTFDRTLLLLGEIFARFLKATLFALVTRRHSVAFEPARYRQLGWIGSTESRRIAYFFSRQCLQEYCVRWRFFEKIAAGGGEVEDASV